MQRTAGFGPLYVQKPFYPEGDACHVYLLHPPGGVAAGDQLDVEVEVGPGAAALVTTPAANKFYRVDAGCARLTQRLRVAEGGSLEWLPQESIFFGGCRAEVATEVQLDPGARFAGWEVICLGRPASGDDFRTGSLLQTIRIGRMEGCRMQERLRERIIVRAGDPMLTAPWGLAGRRILATLHVTPVDREMLRMLRRAVAPAGPSGMLIAATLVDDVLVVRVLGDDCEPVRDHLESVWSTLRPALLGRAPCRPRIWNT